MTSYLQNMVDNLEIDMDEAVLTWLEDEGYICNDEQEELEEKAKDNKVLASLKSNTKGEHDIAARVRHCGNEFMVALVPYLVIRLLS